MKSFNFLPHICVNKLRPTGIGENHILLQWLTTCLLAPIQNQGKTRGCVTLCALPFTLLKSIWRQKKNYGNSNISPCMQQYNLPKKKSSKRNQNPSRYYYNSRTKSQVPRPAKISSFKNPHPLSYYNSIMNLNTISLPW
jgi:hypothetical protein